MKNLLYFNEFNEGNFFDGSKIISKSDKKLGQILNDIKNITFIDDSKLLKYFTSKKYYNKSKINLEINWYDDIKHSIINRLKLRTNFKSTSEFNSYIKDKLNILIPKHIPDMYEIGKYLLYDKSLNISIIIFNDLSYEKISIITIINGYNNYDIISEFMI